MNGSRLVEAWKLDLALHQLDQLGPLWLPRVPLTELRDVELKAMVLVPQVEMLDIDVALRHGDRTAR